MIFYPHYCIDCGCLFVDKKKHARCWSCNSTNTVNGYFNEYYDGDKCNW